MAKIVKTKDAPEGDLDVTFGGESFTVGDSGYETEDAAVAGQAANHPFFKVESSKEDTIDPRAQERERRAAEKAREKAAEHNATLQPGETPVDPDPTTEDDGSSKDGDA